MRTILLLTILIASGVIGTSLETIAASAPTEVEQSRISDIAQDGLAEVNLGKLAETKGSTTRVKNFGKQMVADHTLTNSKLKAAAEKSQLTLPTTVTDSQKATYNELSKLSGIAFDRKYAAEMVEGHARAVDAIDEESRLGTGVLKQWAEKTIPVVKNHSAIAKQLDTDIEKSRE
jgi:putative membrane protein